MIGPIKKIDAIAVLGLILIISAGCSRSSGQNVANSSQKPTIIAKGADISWLTQMEAAGMRFYNNSGSEQDCFQILKDDLIAKMRSVAGEEDWEYFIGSLNATATGRAILLAHLITAAGLP